MFPVYFVLHFVLPDFICVSALDPLVHGVSHDKLHSALGKGAAAASAGGLGVITAGVFLAGEMAGSGVLALPNAMVGTGEEHVTRVRCFID